MTRHPPNIETLRTLCRKLALRPADLLRKQDPAYKEHGLGANRHSDEALLALMARHPGLIQRPIAVKGQRAVVARPIAVIDVLLA